MIENLGKPINPPKVDHRIFWVKKGSGKMEEISFEQLQKLNHAAFEERRPCPNIVKVNEKCVSFCTDDYVFNFVRADLEEILAACPIIHKEQKTTEGQ
jgi:hypothetical protein